jgi:hypothetical protein
MVGKWAYSEGEYEHTYSKVCYFVVLSFRFSLPVSLFATSTLVSCFDWMMLESLTEI